MNLTIEKNILRGKATHSLTAFSLYSIFVIDVSSSLAGNNDIAGTNGKKKNNEKCPLAEIDFDMPKLTLPKNNDKQIIIYIRINT